MATQDPDQEKIGELRGFLQGYAKLHQALTISRFEHDVVVLPVENEVEETLQSYFDSLGKKLKPPVKHWDMKLEELKPWEQPAEELFARWLLADEGLREFYRTRRENDPIPFTAPSTTSRSKPIAARERRRTKAAASFTIPSTIWASTQPRARPSFMTPRTITLL